MYFRIGLALVFIISWGPRSLKAWPQEEKSSIDIQFINKRSKGGARTNVKSPAAVGAYRSILSRTLGSECVMYPSDSAYTLELLNRCSGLVAWPRFFARMTMENDASRIYASYSVLHNEIVYPDFPSSCRLFD